MTGTVLAAKLKDRVLFGFDAREYNGEGFDSVQKVRTLSFLNYDLVIAADCPTRTLDHIADDIFSNDTNIWNLRQYVMENYSVSEFIAGSFANYPIMLTQVPHVVPSTAAIGVDRDKSLVRRFLSTDYSHSDIPADEVFETMADILRTPSSSVVIYSLSKDGFNQEFLSATSLNMPYEEPKDAFKVYNESVD